MINLGEIVTAIMPSTSGKRLFCPGLKTTSCLTVVMLVCLETVLLSTVSNCAKTFYMHWNTTNSIFRIDNTDHIIDVNKGNSAFEYDQVHIICPLYQEGTFDNETEKYIIYNVSKVEYETCRITHANPRIIAICDKPHKVLFFTITFRPFTPQPGGLEFLPGNDYYFISTSSKDDLHRRIGGRCSTNNMKVVFKVCCAPDAQNDTHSGSSSASDPNSGGSSNGGSASNGGGSTGVSINTNIDQSNRIQSSSGGRVNPPMINTNTSNIVQSTMGWPKLNNPHSTPVTSTVPVQQFYPHMTSPRPNINSAINNNYSNYSPSHKPTKKTNEYDKHPNEVVKNEELTYNSNAGNRIATPQCGAIALLSLLLGLHHLMMAMTNVVAISWWCQR